MKVLIEVNNYHLLCAVIAGVESGIAYWCREVKGYAAMIAQCTSRIDVVQGIRFLEWLDSGGNLTITEADTHEKDQPTKVYTFGKDQVTLALHVMAEKYPHHLKNLIADSGDAETGDVLIQLGIFGDIIYG